MKNNDTFINIDDALCFTLYKAHRLMNNSYRKHLQALNLTYPQFLVMACLWNENKKSQKELCEKLGLDSGTITPLVKRLINMKLITKERSLQDEREIILRVTSDGKKLKKVALDVPDKMFCELKGSTTTS